ncbi:hypothetical protein [Sulfitobacter sp. KE37]|uniref:hypothetical protein n=1 Tax=Sulfitobacter sp. KE37 TaxID=2731136 RepID=UPI0023E24DBD|nr:hypothetical protein [Sulfitobacter sp. KE37]
MALFLALWCYPLQAEAACLGAEALPNRVIALVDGREESPFETSRIARRISSLLARKGLYPLYVDISEPLPVTFDTTHLAGVISWFAVDVPEAQKLADWLIARDKDCGETLAHVAIGQMGGAPIWQRLGVDRARGDILYDGARDKIKVAPNWEHSGTPVEVPPGVVLAPVLPSGGEPIVQISAEDGWAHVLGFQRGQNTWLSDHLVQGPAGRAAINLERVLASYKGSDPTPVPDLAMFQGRRIALSVLLADGWELRAHPSEDASLGTPAYTFVRRIFLADAVPVTFGWPDPILRTAPLPPHAAAAANDLIEASHVQSLPLKEAQNLLSLGTSPAIRLLPESLDGSNASPLPAHSTIVPLSGPAGFGDPTGLHARAAAVARSATPWPSAPDTLLVRAQDLLTEAGQTAVAQARALHASSSRAAMDLVQYAELLKGAMSTQIKPMGAHRWQITDRGALHTLRFDHSHNLSLDIDRSTGVLGSWTIGSALFIALDPAVDRAVVVLRAEHDAAETAAQKVEVVEAGPRLERLQRDGCLTTAMIEGSGQVTLRANFEPQILLEGKRLSVTSRPNDLWRFRVPEHQKDSLKLTLAVGCR